MKILISFLAITLATLSLNAAHHESHIETYKIDATHSSVKFSIRHFVAKTTGSFPAFEGTIVVDKNDMTQSLIVATIDVPTINTANEKRDSHLQEDDYFNTKEYSKISFKSTQWAEAEGKNKYTVTGNLTMRGVTKPVTLDVELLGFGDGMRGAYLSGWEATTTLNRTEWGINGGQPAVGEEVDVLINIEAVRQ